MPTGKHSNHKGGRPRRKYKSKLVAVHFESEEEEAQYMALSPRQRVTIALASEQENKSSPLK